MKKNQIRTAAAKARAAVIATRAEREFAARRLISLIRSHGGCAHQDWIEADLPLWPVHRCRLWALQQGKKVDCRIALIEDGESTSLALVYTT